MTVELYAVTCGHLTIPSAFLLAKTKGWLTVPVPAYVIVHPRGKVVFDSGMHLRAQTDARRLISVPKVSRPISRSFSPGEEIAARLDVLSIAPGEITHLINSHLHYDHAGGKRAVAQRRDRAAARRMGSRHGATRARRRLSQGRLRPPAKPVRKLAGRARSLRRRHDRLSADPRPHARATSRCACGPRAANSYSAAMLAISSARSTICILPGIVADKEAALAVFHRFREMQRRAARASCSATIPDFLARRPRKPRCD